MNKSASISYIFSSFIELTRTCHQNCGYCSFVKEDSPLISTEELKHQLADISKRNATEVVFVSGESPQEYPHIQIDLHRNGFSSYTEFLLHACELAIKENLIPVLATGYIDAFSAERFSKAGCVVRVNLVASALSAEGQALEKSRGRNPSTGKAAIEALHAAEVPYSIGFNIGIGETEEDRLAFIREIGQFCTADPLLQDIRIIPFQPTPDCSMSQRPPLPFEAVEKTVATVREIFPVHHISVPPYLFNRYPKLIDAGLNDLGSVPILTGDPSYTTFDVPTFETMKSRLELVNIHLYERSSLSTPAAINRESLSATLPHLTKMIERRNSSGLNLIDNLHCFVCGPRNPLGLNIPIKKHTEGHTCTFTWTAGPAYQGYAGIVHGGMLSTLLDEAMAHAVMGDDTLAVTADIKIRFHRPAPVGLPLKFIATRVGQRKHLHFARSSVVSPDGTVLAEAEGRFAEI